MRLTPYHKWIVAFVLTILLTPAGTSHANDEDIEKAGDILQFVLPGIACASTIILKDWEGLKQFAVGGVVTIAVAQGTKFITEKARPDESDNRSFPSGHTAAAFYGPAFVQFRYGWKYSVPLYIGAAFVGYSRMNTNKHWADDVFFGASAALVINWIFTKPYYEWENVQVSPTGGSTGLGLSFRVQF